MSYKLGHKTKIVFEKNSKQSNIKTSKLSFDKSELSDNSMMITMFDSVIPLSDAPNDSIFPQHYEIIKSALENRRNENLSEENYLFKPFRMLTATKVGSKSWKSTDFSNAELLKNSMPVFDNVPIKTEHNVHVENTAGIVDSVFWDEETTFPNGQKIPSGINGIYAIDKINNPKLAENVRTGATNSTSVTIEFNWIPSHTFKTEDEFAKRVGSIVDGKEVTRIVTEIINVHETSLVFLGADPYAKQIDKNGSLIRPDYGSYSKNGKFPEEEEVEFYKSIQKNKKINVVCKNEKFVLTLTKQYEGVNTNEIVIKKQEMDLKIENRLKELLNLSSADDLTVEMLESLSKEMKPKKLKKGDVGYKETDDEEKDEDAAEEATETPKEEKDEEGAEDDEETKKAKNAKAKKKADAEMAKESSEFSRKEIAFKGIIQSLTSEIKSLELDNKNSQAFSKAGERFLNDRRTLVIEAYKKNEAVKGKTADEKVIASFQKENDVDVLNGFATSYGASLAEQFTMTCENCKSTNVQMRSSQSNSNLDNPKTDLNDNVQTMDNWVRKISFTK